MEKTELTCADLALYIGCECKTPTRNGVIDAVSRDRVRVESNDGGGIILPPDDVWPILRPLYDITEDEESETQHLVNEIGFGYELGAQITVYLLSRQFDLFGWIDAGLAIDKTKL